MAEEEKRKPEAESEDPRVAGIATVGWVSLAMLGISIPLVAQLKEVSVLLAGALPIVIMLGAGLMAVRVWSTGEKTVNRRENEALRKRMAELEERLASLEMVDSLEAHFARRHGASASSLSEAESPTVGPTTESSSSS